MRIAVLMTNTGEEDRGIGRPDDGARIGWFLRAARPDWDVSVHEVVTGPHPAGVPDGIVISGSSASVNDPDPWIAALKAEIRGHVAAGRPTLGICFGHQAIAAALGGRVRHEGWIMGRAELAVTRPQPWMLPARPALGLYASNEEQVVALPPGAEVLGGDARCPNALVAFGPRALGIQYHPEFTADYARAMVDDREPATGAAVAEGFRATLSRGADGALFGLWAARFLEGI